ncbi:E3 ubiquitin-protein ligase AIP2-like [Papaver somniferum]|uniref:E3 ubiquitin-protein ligase AIP2-like n=1 Tax=Papaver somniferum TaxID=3469 RepID=UPI000E6F995F|nr:E3 ubiquitin-protein ligase AIP2-like [Papaver somniferum]
MAEQIQAVQVGVSGTAMSSSVSSMFVKCTATGNLYLMSENLVINDKMQESPCKHLYHPLCLIPWMEKHNTCPVCRHELPTDNQAYESWKESEKEAEKA